MIDVRTFRDIKIWYRSQTEDELVLNDSFDNDIFYKELPYLNISPRPVIVDVGAHIGTFSIYSSLKFPTATIYSFEASNETYSLLSTNTSENNLSGKIKIFPHALCSIDGPVKLYHNLKDGNWGHTISKSVSSSYETVEGISLSTFMSKQNIEKIDLIKFNCEGAEFEIIINSPAEILSRIKCAIILYHTDLVSEDISVLQLKKKLVDAGLHCFFLHQTENRGWIIAVNRKYYSAFLFQWTSKLKRRLRSWKASR